MGGSQTTKFMKVFHYTVNKRTCTTRKLNNHVLAMTIVNYYYPPSEPHNRVLLNSHDYLGGIIGPLSMCWNFQEFTFHVYVFKQQTD